MASITDRLKSAWNAFNGRDQTRAYADVGMGASYRPDRSRIFYTPDRSIVKAVTTRIAMDVAAVSFEHVKVDENKNRKETIESELNERLNLSANIDQTGRAFIQDAVESMFDEGVVALVPTDLDFATSINKKDPEFSEGFVIDSIRTGKIIEWYPRHVKVRVYNERTGKHEDVVVAKSYTAIIQNPLYSIMNEPNSTLQRLMRTYNDLDNLNAKSTSGKLDLIIQLPYVVKSDLRMQQAEHRRKLIEDQLTGSKYGIAYIDGTEKITQLNRPLENNLWGQAKDLEDRLFNQLGLTQAVFDGSANEAAMLNYYTRTVEPVAGAFVEEMRRKFLSDNARSRGQSIVYYRDPFKLVPVSQLADIADRFTRNEILSPNEVRAEIGYKPNPSPSSDELRNRNMPYDATMLGNENQDMEYDEEADAEGMEPEESEEELEETKEQERQKSINEYIKMLGGKS